MKIKDSGDRTVFETGAVRDMHEADGESKGRCDLLPLDVAQYVLANAQPVLNYINVFKGEHSINSLRLIILEVCDFNKVNHMFDSVPEALLEVSKHFEEGAEKYGENNWQKGIPVHCYIDSAIRHYLKYLAGYRDERHDRAFIWNILCCMWTIEHKPEMDDFTEAKSND